MRVNTLNKVIVHLVDGTYELYRQYYGQARHSSKKYAAVEGVLASTRQLVDENSGPVGVATDHIIESFRNCIYGGYKTSEGMEPEILDQIPVLEERLQEIGVTVWPMVDFEADDALASAARAATQDPRVHQVRIYSPDKDFGQCLRGRRILQIDRRKSLSIDETAIRERYGIQPSSIPDYLALVGDRADGIPGLYGWGHRAASEALSAWSHIERIPLTVDEWKKHGFSAKVAAKRISQLYENALSLKRDVLLATLVTTLECKLP